MTHPEKISEISEQFDNELNTIVFGIKADEDKLAHLDALANEILADTPGRRVSHYKHEASGGIVCIFSTWLNEQESDRPANVSIQIGQENEEDGDLMPLLEITYDQDNNNSWLGVEDTAQVDIRAAIETIVEECDLETAERSILHFILWTLQLSTGNVENTVDPPAHSTDKTMWVPDAIRELVSRHTTSYMRFQDKEIPSDTGSTIQINSHQEYDNNSDTPVPESPHYIQVHVEDAQNRETLTYCVLGDSHTVYSDTVDGEEGKYDYAEGEYQFCEEKYGEILDALQGAPPSETEVTLIINGLTKATEKDV